MRLCFVYFALTAMVVSLAGCQSFQQKLSSSKSSMFGLKKNKEQADLSDELLDPLGARNTNRLLLDDLAPNQIATTLKIRASGANNQQNAETRFQQGKQKFDQAAALKKAEPNGTAYQKMFVDAANEFRIAGASWQDSTLEEESLFKEGESYFFADRYVQSNRAFEKLVASYSGTRYLDLAEQRRYQIAVYWLGLAENYDGPNFIDAKRPRTGLESEARRVLHRIRIDDPTGKLADDATLALGKAFMSDSRWYEAGDAFEDLRRNYPGSKHQFTAHMLELEARLNSYQGKSYDDKPLQKADALMKSIVRQFPQQSKEQLPYLEQQAGTILTKLAERDYSMGQYFENRGENRSALFYYQQVAEKYKDTSFGAEMKDQITEVAELPPVPKQHGKWLINMFPSTEDEKPLITAGDNESIFR